MNTARELEPNRHFQKMKNSELKKWLVFTLWHLIIIWIELATPNWNDRRRNSSQVMHQAIKLYNVSPPCTRQTSYTDMYVFVAMLKVRSYSSKAKRSGTPLREASQGYLHIVYTPTGLEVDHYRQSQGWLALPFLTYHYKSDKRCLICM